MPPLTIPDLIAAGITPTLARLFADPLQATFERWEINKPVRRAAFIAEAAHESRGFAELEENLYYRTPERIRQMWPERVPTMREAQTLLRDPHALANRVYSGWLGNGDAASGEGWRYRGRGLFHLTGLANYFAAGQALGRPYVEQPELVSLPLDAAMTAGWFWSTRGLNALADGSQIDAITKRINPAMAGADDRRSRFDEALRALA
jgi:putative chitinase